MGLVDTVSLLVHCNGELFLISTQNKECQLLPNAPIFKNNWTKSANKLINNLLLKPKSMSILKITKLWMPDDFLERSVHHVVYQVAVSLDQQSAERDLKFLTLNELQLLHKRNNLVCPSIFTWISMLNLENLKSEDSENSLTIHNAWSNTEFLTEISKQHITDINCLELLETVEFTKNDQIFLYKDFLRHCFPYLTMNYKIFKHIMTTSMGWLVEDCHHLFRTADISNNSSLSYSEYLYLFAVCDKYTKHVGRTAELRCRYIFRYYDVEKSGKITLENFKKLIKDIRRAKKQLSDAASIDKDVEIYSLSLGISDTNPMRLNQFLMAAGELKFRGTASILRFNKSMKQYLQKIDAKNCDFFNDTKKRREAGGESVDSEHIVVPSPQDNGMRLALYSLYIKKYGADITYDRTWKHSDWVSPSSIGPMKYMKDTQSSECFNQKSPQNEIINLLKYFAFKGTITLDDNNTEEKVACTWGNVNLKNFGQALIKVCNGICDQLKTEQRMLEVKSPVYIFGDIHGNFADLRYFEQVFWPLSLTFSPASILFLGDYVDRGAYGVEVIAYLFAYKIDAPNKVLMIRGNHETRDIQKAYTFYHECIQKFGKTLGIDVWTAINNCFDVMPLAARIDKKIFCCHGGIPPPSILRNLSCIKYIPINLPIVHIQCPLAWNLMWNDPIRENETSDYVRRELDANEGFAKNTKRGTGYFFSAKALEHFLQSNGLTHLIRAHELQHAGISIQFSGKLLTVFSSSRYCGEKNEAACIFCDEGKIRVMRIDTNTV